jgi:hypothetical protein
MIVTLFEITLMFGGFVFFAEIGKLIFNSKKDK